MIKKNYTSFILLTVFLLSGCAAPSNLDKGLQAMQPLSTECKRYRMVFAEVDKANKSKDAGVIMYGCIADQFFKAPGYEIDEKVNGGSDAFLSYYNSKQKYCFDVNSKPSSGAQIDARLKEYAKVGDYIAKDPHNCTLKTSK